MSAAQSLERISFASAGAVPPAAARRRQLTEMFSEMSAEQLMGVYEQAQADGDAEITEALDRFMAE